MEALTQSHDGSVQMIDTSLVRVHQHDLPETIPWERKPWNVFDAGGVTAAQWRSRYDTAALYLSDGDPVYAKLSAATTQRDG